ncbi:hypothetical protein [Xylanimonas allomyrinae]|uniref:hypothetical protein n=1 Tax=Xylanimonas allomyrinae TaxID=2509459 RepID=UPI0013A63488|nr:hypothetical protein [Xylanimonas allomyrinae]
MDTSTREFGDEMREEVRDLLARGLKRRQIALRLGISETKVSEFKADLAAAGRLPAVGSVVVLDAARDVDDDAPPTRRSRSAILLEHAALKATTLGSTTRTLLDHIVLADEWVTDSAYADAVRAAVSDAVQEAITVLDQIAAELGIDEPTAAGPTRQGSRA